jgi:hypothetical protein
MMDNFFKSGSPVRKFIPTFQQRARESDLSDSTFGLWRFKARLKAKKAEVGLSPQFNAALKRTVVSRPRRAAMT